MCQGLFGKGVLTCFIPQDTLSWHNELLQSQPVEKILSSPWWTRFLAVFLLHFLFWLGWRSFYVQVGVLPVKRRPGFHCWCWLTPCETSGQNMPHCWRWLCGHGRAKRCQSQSLRGVCVTELSRGTQILLIAFVPQHYHDKPFGMVKERLVRDHLDVKYMEWCFMGLYFFVTDLACNNTHNSAVAFISRELQGTSTGALALEIRP